MPDRDDIFGRYWQNDRRGIHYTAEQVSALTSSVPEKSRIYYGLKQIIYPQISYSALHQVLTTENGCADIEARSARSQEMPQEEVYQTGAPCDWLLQDKAHIEYRFAGHAADPLSGVAMRQTIEGGLVALRLNLVEFWRLKTEAHRRNIRFALALPLLALGGYGVASIGQCLIGAGTSDMNIVMRLAMGCLPLGMLAANWIRAVMRTGQGQAEHDKWSAGVASVSRRNARQINTDLAGQRAYIQDLVDETTLHAELCLDEVRINGEKLDLTPPQKALRGRLARWLTAVMEGHYDYQRICHYLMACVAEGIESEALYHAFYHDLGPRFRLRRGLWRHLALMAVAVGAASLTIVQWPQPYDLPAVVGIGAGLSACLLSILQALGLMRRFDVWLKGELPPDLIAEITSGQPQGPSPGGHLEGRLFDAERIETLQQLAEEERRRLH